MTIEYVNNNIYNMKGDYVSTEYNIYKTTVRLINSLEKKAELLVSRTKNSVTGNRQSDYISKFNELVTKKINNTENIEKIYYIAFVLNERNYADLVELCYSKILMDHMKNNSENSFTK